jgi:hypothetical protein
MARPKKQTIDYFPHYCKHGKTIYILEQKYQSKGYAFWFKLLEELGNKNGHFIDLNEETELEFLSAKTWFLPVETLEVLNLLAKLNAIDQNLWRKKIVWCQNLIDNISDVYKNRRTDLPQKPISTDNNLISTDDNPITTDDKPQSKVKESKVNKTKVIVLSSNDDALPFNPLTYINQLITNKQRHINIIGLYWKTKGYNHPTLKAAQEALKRDLRSAKALTGYSNQSITNLMEWLENQSQNGKLDYEWKLSTIVKKIDDYLKETKI